MPSRTFAEVFETLRKQPAMKRVSKHDLAVQILLLMEVWATRFPEDSLPREMNSIRREWNKEGRR
jgi:hypothetical protein